MAGLAELEDGRAGGKLTSNHPLVHDALVMLVIEGGMTMRRLAHYLNTDEVTAARAARILKREGEVKTGRTPRGRLTAKPCEGGPRGAAIRRALGGAA